MKFGINVDFADGAVSMPPMNMIDYMGGRGLVEFGEEVQAWVMSNR